MNIQELYNTRCAERSDISEHLPILKSYAERVRHITEFGVRTGNSTAAFLMGLSLRGGEMYSYDIGQNIFFPPPIPGVTWTFIKEDTTRMNMRPTELLFIDSSHEYVQLKLEFLNALKISRYIMLHDTTLEPAVHQAEMEFLAANADQWKIIAHYENNNGLHCLERIRWPALRRPRRTVSH